MLNGSSINPRKVQMYHVMSQRRGLKLFLFTASVVMGLGCQSQFNNSLDSSLKVYKPEKSFKGFTLVPEEGEALVRLVNHLGHTVHRWNVDADRARLLPSCNLLVVHGTKWGIKVKPWRDLREEVREYSWDGQVVWQHKVPDVAHHDVQRLDDGSTLLLYRTIVPEEFQMQIKDRERRRYKIRSDSVALVDKNGGMLWQWHAHEHLDLNYEGAGGMSHLAETNGGRHRMHDWTHINTISFLPPNKWFDDGDIRFRPGNLLIHLRNWSQSLIVDRATGEKVWEYSGDFQGGVGGGHEAHMIPPGFPGAGNILLFDNGRVTHAEQSLVIEFAPPSKEVVWYYQDGTRFFSKAAGSVQRLPNGNTFISQDKSGRLFEVNSSGEIVWEYQSKAETNRAQRYPPTYCSKLADLSPEMKRP
jgi:Arylsulfotransferase (ASST)